MTPRYECDKCGACCAGHLIIETTALDVMREPKLIEADPHYASLSREEVLTQLDSEWRALIIACGTCRPCVFLGSDKRCAIYPTRPNACVGLQPGDEQCQFARRAAGLPPLEPVADGPVPACQVTVPGNSSCCD